MTPIELSDLAALIVKGIDQVVQTEVRRAVSEIPFQVQQELRRSIDYDMREILRAKLRERLQISVSITEGT